MKHAHTTLVSVATLAGHLADPDWVIFDCRHELANPEAGVAAYATGHIPGARFLHCDRDLSGAKTGGNGRHPMPDRAALLATLRAAGVSDHSQVVAYDAAGGMFAARLWWLLRWLGHERVALLDGGLQAWQAAGLGLDAAQPGPAAGTLGDHPSLVAMVDAGGVLARLADPTLCLVDARGPERFRGDVEPIDPVAGHIPGARNRPFPTNLQADGRFKPAPQLRDEWLAVLGGAPADQVIHQCGSGVSACQNVLAMEIAGLHGARLYPGSWSEWCADPARPVARGG